MMVLGYPRVSTDGKSVDAEAKALRVAGAEKVWRETASGAKPIALGSAEPWRRLTRATCFWPRGSTPGDRPARSSIR